MDSDLQKRFDFACEIARQAGDSTMQHFGHVDFEKKDDATPVTIADRNAEQLIRNALGDTFSDDAVIGEEFGESSGTSGFRWIIDPIDGTKSFISGVPLFGTMVAVEKDGNASIGAIYFPGLGIGIYGCDGAPTVYGETNSLQTAKVSGKTSLAESVFVTSAARTFAKRNAAEVYDQLESRCYFTRTWGDCYGYYLVATGQVDLMIDPLLSIWDAAAIQPILKGAGGVFVDWEGQERIDAGEAIGMAPGIAEEVLQLTRPFAGKLD